MPSGGIVLLRCVLVVIQAYACGVLLGRSDNAAQINYRDEESCKVVESVDVLLRDSFR